jgi:3-oxoacyl-[acyl-carrier-protein] synthase-3
MIRAQIRGAATTCQDRVVDNEWLPPSDTSDEWIRSRLHRAAAFRGRGVDTSDLAIRAARAALDNASMVPDDIDATSSWPTLT